MGASLLQEPIMMSWMIFLPHLPSTDFAILPERHRSSVSSTRTLFGIDRWNEKTILRRIGNGIDDDADGVVDEDDDSFWLDTAEDGGEQLGILQLDALTDVDEDGELDFLSNADDFRQTEIPLQKEKILFPLAPINWYCWSQVLCFPLDDPRKAFSETGKDSQIQPHVTILLTTRPGYRFDDKWWELLHLSVQTTVSQRHLQSVLFPDP